jgi:hypothetical protein
MFKHFQNFCVRFSLVARGMMPSLWLALAVLLMLSVGCGSSKKAGRAEKPPIAPQAEPDRSSTEAESALNEDFDPMTLKAQEFRIPHKQTAKSADPFATLKPAAIDTSWQTVPGYQIQLLQTDDARLARETVKEAILVLEKDVEIVFEAPYYKVRAGRFTSRYDAEQLQNLAAEKGYANSWVVRTQVKVRASELLNPK